jgi:ankyrin repeat protein
LKHIGLIELLLGRGADINAVNRSTSSVLGSAVDSGHYDTVKYLLDNGADANLPPGSFSAISRAAYHGNIDLVKLLLRDTSESTVYTHRDALHHAAAAGHVDIVQLLLNRNFAINARDSSGETPLLSVCAANRAHPRVVALLLRQGADISAQGRKGDTACKFLISPYRVI